LTSGPGKYRFEIDHIEGYTAFNKWLRTAIVSFPVVCLQGTLGAGKTTFVHQFCRREFGIDDMSSPSYAIINMHDANIGLERTQIAHVDLYRLKDTQEALDAGIEDLIYAGHPVFIEWPKIILPLLERYIDIKFFVEDQNKRIITAVIHGA
jgi:tRNA threonylcarbamoyladenosine biosynthesis protein TsaE